MKKIKKVSLIMAIVTLVGMIGITAYAATGTSPLEIAKDVTGKSQDELVKERQNGKTYGQIAKDAGKEDEFHSASLEAKKEVLDQRVKDGVLTQEEADKVYAQIKEHQEDCDGTGGERLGKEYGIGFGNGEGAGNGEGNGKSDGKGRGNKGNGLRDGSGKGQGNGFNSMNCVEDDQE